MAMRFWLVAAVLGLLFAGTWSIPRAAADVTWELVETGCSNGFNTCHQSPLTLGSITGSGTYLSSAPFGANFSETGDFIATFFYSPLDITALSPNYCAPADSACNVDISVTSTPAGLTGHFDFESYGDQTAVDLNFNGNTFFAPAWGNDGGALPGCGNLVACSITGELDPVPEPSSLPVLLAGLGMIGGALFFGRKKALPA